MISHVGDFHRIWEPVASQSDPTSEQVFAIFGVLDRVKTVRLSNPARFQFPLRSVWSNRAPVQREHLSYQGFKDIYLTRFAGHTGGKLEHFGASSGCPGSTRAGLKFGYDQSQIAFRHDRRRPSRDLGPGAARVDLKVINHGIHGKGQGIVKFSLGGSNQFENLVSDMWTDLRIHKQTHATTGHSAQHEEAPELISVLRLHAFNNRFSVTI